MPQGFFVSSRVLGEHPRSFVWWSRGESNPRPQAILRQFYMRSSLI